METAIDKVFSSAHGFVQNDLPKWTYREGGTLSAEKACQREPGFELLNYVANEEFNFHSYPRNVFHIFFS